MKGKFAFITLLSVVFIVGFIVGCGEDSPDIGSGDPRAVHSIELRVTNNIINGLVGENRLSTITAIARNASGVGVPGIRIQLGIRDPETWKGTIALSQSDSLTNENGQMTATYSVILEQSATVTIEARVSQVVATRDIILEVRQSVGILSIETARNVLSVAPGTTKQTQVTATLTDSSGLAIPGVEIKFRTSPATMGYVDSDTATTNSSGRATRTFTSIPDQYGVVDVIASVGEMSKSVRIEIRPVAGPDNITLMSENTTIRVAEGVNAQVDLTAYVVDANGVGVPNTTVEFRLEPYVAGERIFGHLAPKDTTDAEGMIINTFQSLGKYGTIWAVAQVLPSHFGDDDGDESFSADRSGSRGTGARLVVKSGDQIMSITDDEVLEDRILLMFERIPDVVRSLTVSALPAYMDLPPDSIGRATIRAVVNDASGIGVDNLLIRYTTNYGSLSNIRPTDSTGVSTAAFSILPITDLPNLDETIIVTVTAEIPGTNWTRSANITVKPLRSDRGTLELTSDTRFIYADAGLTYATLRATLKNEDGQVLPGRNISFSSNYGVVSPVVVTDSLGIATAIFTDTGVPSLNQQGDPDSAVIVARYSPMGIQATARIMIREQNPVQQIMLRSARQTMYAGSPDTSIVTATCVLADGQPAPDGTLVNFRANIGTYLNYISAVSGGMGSASSTYQAGGHVGLDSLLAFVRLPGEDDIVVISNIVEINLIPGQPHRIFLSADPRTLFTNDPESFSTITATVEDSAGNRVRSGILVNFETDYGTVQPSGLTDESGRTQAILRPGVQAGIATVRAWIQLPGEATVDERVTVTFVSGTANSIELEADPLQIQVRGTGGQQFSTLRAIVRDANGNLVEFPTTVVFELINEPPENNGGANINNRGQSDSTRTSNGVATATVNSGTQIGSKLIRAYTWRDHDAARLDTVSINLSTLAVVAGPPSALDIDINNEGEDVGGGSWLIEVSARVWDIYMNPVADRIPVMFTVDPQIASISPGHTGNEGRSGATTKGLAYANLVYQSVNTFDPLEISANVQTMEGIISGRQEILLPLQQGQIELHVDPANWMFSDDNPLATIRTWVVLRDGHGVLINNAPILFTSNRARFYWYDFRRNRYEMYYPEPARKYTGVVSQDHNERPGQATVYIRAIEPNIFIDPFTLEVTVQINARVEGYDDVTADPGFIYFTRGGE